MFHDMLSFHIFIYIHYPGLPKLGVFICAMYCTVDGAMREVGAYAVLLQKGKLA